MTRVITRICYINIVMSNVIINLFLLFIYLFFYSACVYVHVYICIKHQAELVYFNYEHAKHSALSKH